MTIYELKTERENRQTALMQECHVFFAFSEKQFMEGRAKHPLAEGDKYTRIPGGGFVWKSKVEDFMAGLDAIEAWYKEQVQANGQREEEIKYQLVNHECYLTGDISTALDDLGEGYTYEEVLAVYKKNLKKHIEFYERMKK